MKVITPEWEEFSKELDGIILDKNFNYAVHRVFKSTITTPLNINTQICCKRIEYIKKYFENIHTVLEIGPGIGNMCRILYNEFDIRTYTICDIESMFRITKFWL